MIKIELAGPEDVEQLVETCIRAFHADVEFLPPGTQPGGPPGYDSEDWNLDIMDVGIYYKICLDEKIVGGLILFDMHNYGRPAGTWNLGRIWVDQRFQSQGIGEEAIRLMFEKHPEPTYWWLDTPDWATRNHHFYEKVGFTLREITEIEAETGWASYIYERHCPQTEKKPA